MRVTHTTSLFKRYFFLIVLVTSLIASTPLVSSESSPSKPVTVELVHQEKTIQPGHPFWVAVNVDMDSGWHSYWKNPGVAGAPIRVEWDLPPGYSVDSIKWPTPTRYVTGDLISYGYEDNVILLARITPPNQIEGDSAEIKAKIRWVACSGDECVPGTADATIALDIRPEQPEVHVANGAKIQNAITALPERNDSIVAAVKGDFIEILLPKGVDADNAYFCPEAEGMIEECHEAILEKRGDQYAVLLKRSSSNDVKGVLVLDDHSSQIAYDISFALNDADDISMADPLVQLDTAIAPDASYSAFWLAFGLAFVGGVILNLMPCVLPIVSLKIMSFMKMAGQSRAATFKHGLSYTFGVLCSFWLLAGALLTLQSYGSSAGWGFQLQNPGFVSILIAIIFTFGLSLLGVFEMGTSLTSFAGKAQSKAKEGLTSSFMSGVLATIVATPCTGPFLGTAVGIATTLPSILALLVFTSLALGMAAPYLLISAFPSLLRFMPKPGNWMVTFKEITGFLMMATVLWLIWVFNSQTNSLALILMLAALLLFAVGSWIFGKWGTPVKTKKVRWIGYAAAAVFFVLGSYTIVEANAFGTPDNEEIAMADSTSSHSWEKFTPARVAELRAQGKPVFVDFTAKWCLTCQLNHAVLVGSDVEANFEEHGVVRMKADWTSHDDVISAELRKFGRNSVPLYVYYPADPNAAPVILPQMLTASIVIDTINTSEEVIAEHHDSNR